jgi:tetratricopeptide (TPR) repeat protein
VRVGLYHNIPYPAARVLEKAIAEGKVHGDAEAWELLANAWIAAREYERALEPLGKAAQLSKDGNLYVRLAQLYLQNEDWKNAAENLQKAVDKGGLKDPGNTELMLGIAYYNEKRIVEARSSFARARQHDSSREAADRWISFMGQESGAG